MLKDKMVAAKEAYKAAKESYFKNRTTENWIKFCDAKKECMLLGIRI